MRVTVFPKAAPLARRVAPVHGTNITLCGQVALVCVLLSWGAGAMFGFENGLAILTGLAFAASIWGLRQPALGVLGITVLCTLDTMTRHLLMTGGLLRWNTLNYWLGLVTILFFGFFRRASDRQSLLAKLFVGFMVAQLVISPDVSLGVQHLLMIVPVFGLMVYFVRGTQDDRIWLWIGLVNGVVGALGGLLFTLQGDRLPVLNHNAAGFFPLTAIFAIALSFPVIAARPGWAMLNGLLAVVNFCWVFLTASRGDLFIGLVCLLFIVWTMRGVHTRALYVAGTVALALFVLGSFPEMRERTFFRVTKLLDAEESTESRTSGRSDLLQGGWHMFLAHPFGVGTGGFQSVWATLGYVEGISGFKYGEEMAAHAGWAKVLAENGIIGFLLFASLIGSFAYTGWRRHDPVARRLGFLVTAVLTVAFTSTEFQPKGLWLLVAGATVVMNREAMQIALEGRRKPLHWRLIAAARPTTVSA